MIKKGILKGCEHTKLRKRASESALQQPLHHMLRYRRNLILFSLLTLSSAHLRSVQLTVKLKKKKNQLVAFIFFIDSIARASERIYWTLSN